MSCDPVGATTQAVETKPVSNSLRTMAISVENLLDGQDTLVVLLTPAQIQQDQKYDLHIGPVMQCMLSGVRPLLQKLRKFKSQSRCLLREWE